VKQSSFEKRLNKVLKEEEHYVLNILLLSYLTDDESYKDIAELCFMFDEYSNFKKFIKYYGGKTLKIPTQEELRLALKHLLLFQYVKIDGMSLDDGYKSVNLKDLGVSKEEASNTIDRFYNYLKENGNEIFRGRKRNKLF
jgi:hypothetical protein